ncbi:MAG TPA: GNAT family N-acetyltransferase [Actinomycetota bacterium]
MEIRAAAEPDWQTLRDVRLRALADAPYAFASRLDVEREHPDQYWRDRAAGRSGAPGVTFLAIADGRADGLVGMFVEPDQPGAGHLVAMWVDPAVRRTGLGRLLVERAIGWARERGLREVHLWVADGNDAAAALYRANGFAPTGRRQPLPSDPSVEEEMFSLALDAAIEEPA